MCCVTSVHIYNYRWFAVTDCDVKMQHGQRFGALARVRPESEDAGEVSQHGYRILQGVPCTVPVF